MTNEKAQENIELTQCIEAFCADNREVTLVSLCTTDGFPISYFSKSDLTNLADKLAAMSSTLSALSDSSATQMNQGQCDITIIETTSGSILFVRASYLGKPCVLTVVAKEKMLLAAARYKTKKLAQTIATFSK